MESISREQLRTQATLFAYDLVAFLERENAESQQAPLRPPRDLMGTLQVIYTCFVSRHRLVTP